MQHTWTYKPLMQDVLGMSLNRVTLDPEPSASQNLLQTSASSKKTYEVSHAAAAEAESMGRTTAARPVKHAEAMLWHWDAAPVLSRLQRAVGCFVAPLPALGPQPSEPPQLTTFILLLEGTVLPTGSADRVRCTARAILTG